MVPFTKHKNTHANHIHSHETPPSPSFSPVLSPFFPFLLPFHSHCLHFFLVPTRTFPTKMHTVSEGGNQTLDQMRTRNGVCSCRHCVCLIFCRGGNCDSRNCRRNLSRAPTGWKRRSDLKHFVGLGVSMGAERRSGFTNGRTAKVECPRGESNFNMMEKRQKRKFYEEIFFF